MLSQLKRQFNEAVSSRLAKRDYQTLPSPDQKDEALDNISLPASDGDLAVNLNLVRELRVLKLTVTVLASLLTFVCIFWARREFWSKDTFINIAELYSTEGDKIDYVPRSTPELYSPAFEAVEYKPVVFHNNFHEDRTPWQGPPTDEVDKAWDAIYRGVGVIKIPKAQAEQLPNHTLPIPGEEDGYIVGLEVYHQLHCLDFIRRALYPDYYGGDKSMNEQEKKEYWIHIDHCVDNLRQTITCYSDISTIPWKWMDRVQSEFPDAHTTHVCRDFEKLTEWMLHPDRHFPQEEYQIRLEAFHAASHHHNE